ncbi:MAG: glycosyltransferase WbuB [Candidatus Bathyarchaeum sp.]|nr:MAG: glycosyltransferase WbuB [Candidatus Bathyarchaeum sp.]
MFKGVYFRFLDNLYRLILKRAEYISVVSEPLKFRVIETHGVEKEKVFVFPNGVDVRAFRTGIASGCLRSSLGVENKKVILFIGGITEDRGLALLVKALPKIVVKNQHVIVLIVGEGPQKFDLKKLAENMGVERFVKFIPPVSHEEIPRYISAADVTVGPLVARSDTFGSVPRKVLEYMACAKPVVVCYASVSRDLIIDGCNGFLIHPGETEELASVILKIISHPSLVAEVGQNARENVEKLYDWDIVMNNFEKVLRVAVAGGKHILTLKNESRD